MSVSQRAVFVSARAPAKINLGLEILGKRQDGFHEIRSVLAMVDLHDDLSFDRGAPDAAVSIDGVPTERNLIDRAMALMRARVPNAGPLRYSVHKRIPMAAGLGGASSDAAATLAGVNMLLGAPLAQGELVELACSLGSDVPFFLGGPAACVKGTGTELETIPPSGGEALLIVPDIAMPRKTATLYAQITPDDYSAGDRVERTVQRLRAGLLPNPGDLDNTFVRPLYERIPELATLPNVLRDAGCSHVGLSGAGPAHYVLLDPSSASELKERIESLLDRRHFRIYATSLLTDTIDPRPAN